MKTLTLTFSLFIVTAVPAFADTGKVLGHDLRHVIMDHDGSMSTGLLVALVGFAIALLVLFIRRSRSIS